jgi:ferric-dicitrate binding protein FerR (iron transport regulator)
MSIPLPDRLWPACHSSLQLDRLLMGELDPLESDRLHAHAAACPRCGQALQAIRAARDERLPPLRLVLPARDSRRWWAAAVAAAGMAAAASLLLVVRPPGGRLKGSGFTLAMYVEHAGEVRRAGPGETVAAGDAVRFAVTAAKPAYVAVLSIDPLGKGSIYFPASARAERVEAGIDVALPLGTRLDATVGEERIVGLFCAAAIELEPVREGLERGDATFPEGCQVTRWSFVKR